MPSLSEADAAAIATQWAARVTDHAGDCMLLNSVKNALLPELSVTVPFYSENDVPDFENYQQAFATLRETLGVWRALSCCRGFGGYENPQFWDKVVRQFVINHGEIEELEWLTFHDEAASPSRVKLSCSVEGGVNADASNKQRVREWMRRVCRELFQVSDDSDNAFPSAEYQSTLQRLQPYIDQYRFAREKVCAELKLVAWKDGKEKYVDPEIMQTYTSILNEIAATCTTDTGGSTTSTKNPRLSLKEVGFDGPGLPTKAEYDAFNDLMARIPFPIPGMCPAINQEIDRVTFSEFVTTILQTKELSARSTRGEPASPGKLHKLTLILNSANRHPLTSFFSALPYAQSLQGLRFIDIQRGCRLSKYECSWLAYACLHPRSKTSNWCEFFMEPPVLTDDGRVVLKDIIEDPSRALSVTRLAVATGVVSTSETRSLDRLQIAIVNKNATIYTRTSVQADALITLSDETELEMCDLHSNNWHCVLVPGYGFGWVQLDDVGGTRDWILEAPVSSSLKKLDMPSRSTTDDALLILSAIGSAMETLTLRGASAIGGILDKVVLRCPALKTLNLEGQVEQLSERSLKRFFSRATGTPEALSVDWEKCNAPVLLKILTNWTGKEAVKRLKKLRLTNMTDNNCSPTQVALLEAMLQANQSLEQLVLSPDESSPWDMRARGAGLEKHNGENIRRDKRLKQRWAFLSVAKQQTELRRQSLLKKLDSGVLTTIFEFATPAVRRIVYLPPIVDDGDDGNDDGDE